METTKENFELFSSEVNYWLLYYGLKDWYVETLWAEDEVPTRAHISWDLEGRVAAIYLSLDWNDDEITSYKLRMAAFHEVTELMLSEIIWMIDERRLENEVQSSIHTVVRRLENTLFQDVYNRRVKTKEITL